MVAGMRSDLGSPELPFAMLMPWPRGAHLIPVLPEFLSGVHALERDLPHFQLVQATDASPLEVYRDRYTSLEESPFSDEVVCKLVEFPIRLLHLVVLRVEDDTLLNLLDILLLKLIVTNRKLFYAEISL